MEMNNPDQVISIRNYYQTNPIEFFTKCLDVDRQFVWEKMEDISLSVRDNKNTAVKAAHGVSKSYTAARVALWFLYCYYPSTVITTAPSHPQVEQILWREIRLAHANAKIPLGGEPTKTQLELAEKWFAYGFATRPDTVTQQATRFQGFHNDHVLVIFDEAAGIMKEIWEAKDALLTSGHCRFLAIGNPTAARGDFVNCFKDSSFNKITISVMDTPNYKTGSEVIPGVSGRDFVESTAKKYGEDSNYYKARVLGEIPSEDADALLQLSWIERAEKHRDIQNRFSTTKRFVTADIADGGDDKGVIKAWENKQEIKTVEIRDRKVEDYPMITLKVLKEIEGNAVIYDADFVGRAFGPLMQDITPDDVDLIAFHGGSTNVPGDFENKRSYGHWKMRLDFEAGDISIAPNDEQNEELATTKLVDNRKGKIQVEKKVEIKKRIGRSPDYNDAIMMMSACFDDVRPISKKDRYVQEEEPIYTLTPGTV